MLNLGKWWKGKTQVRDLRRAQALKRVGTIKPQPCHYRRDPDGKVQVEYVLERRWV